jgi:adenylate cyclase
LHDQTILRPRHLKGERIGTVQLLNKPGQFTDDDLSSSRRWSSRRRRHRASPHGGGDRAQTEQLESSVSSPRSPRAEARALFAAHRHHHQDADAERSTLFINDEKTNELFTEVGEAGAI